MKTRALFLSLALTSVLVACAPQDQQSTVVPSTPEDFQYLTEQFADLRILRYQVPGFDELEVEKKKLLYYLIRRRCRVATSSTTRTTNTIFW
jgi:dipeptidyl-peptidase-3